MRHRSRPATSSQYLRAAWDLGVDVNMYIDTVHQLSDLGAVITHTAHGTSHEGSDVEWREINLLTVEGERFTRCELFDEADIDAALARFEQLSPPTRRLENAASRVHERFWACFAAREWDALAEILADDFYSDDRRRVVDSGSDSAGIAVIVEISGTCRCRRHERDVRRLLRPGGSPRPQCVLASSGDDQSEAFHVEVLDVSRDQRRRADRGTRRVRPR